MPSKIDLTGQRFGRLLVLEDTQKRTGKGEVIWRCKCDCGNETEVRGGHLRTKNVQSCRCLAKEMSHKCNSKKLIGQTFGKLTVVAETKQRANGQIVWLCQCECGNTHLVSTGCLTTGKTKSCGCISSSVGESYIENILNQNNIQYQREYTEPSLNKKRFDFAIIVDNRIVRLIEFDGRQHYEYTGRHWDTKENFIKRKESDQFKNQWALQKNIPLVRIPYWELDNLDLTMLMNNQYLVKEDE